MEGVLCRTLHTMGAFPYHFGGRREGRDEADGMRRLQGKTLFRGAGSHLVIEHVTNMTIKSVGKMQ